MLQDKKLLWWVLAVLAGSVMFGLVFDSWVTGLLVGGSLLIVEALVARRGRR